MNEEVTIKCKCCGKRTYSMGNKKYCDGCAEHTLKLHREISNLKHQIRIMKKKFFGTSDGRQRVR